VEARALDDKGNERPTGTITVRAMPLLTIPIPLTTVSTATCTGVSLCRVQVSAATLTRAGGSTTGAGALAFDATASDLSNPANAAPEPARFSFPTRGAFITGPGQMTIAANIPLTGSTGSGFNIPARNSTVDVAFHAGSGFDLTSQPQATNFSDVIDRSLRLFFGGDPTVGTTSTMTDEPRVAFWVSQKPATVVLQPGSNPPGLCDRTHVDYVSFAEVQAVIHTVNCRDNADGNGATFSAELGGGFPVENIVWHEFHHAAYDLADEYPPDGGYFQTGDLPNVMSSANECTLKGAEPQFCAQIGTSGWWRASPNPDVMVNNTRENLDETRRATLIYNRCKAAQC
jgi:hypothetical protein